jgi:hypothetical protein
MGSPGRDEHDDATTWQDLLMRYVELRRHTDNEGDRLTPQGAADAEKIGRDLLHPPYAAFVSTGAARVTQMLEIVRHAVGQDDTPITPMMSARARGTAPCAWSTVSCMVSSFRFGGGMGSRPRRAHSRLGGPLSY